MEIAKKSLDKILEYVCISLFGALVILVTWQVVTRFILNNPSSITEELAKYCFVWLVLFGAAYVFGENGHMRIEFVQDAMPKKMKILAQVFIELSIIAFAGAVMLVGGFAGVQMAWTQMSAALQIPVGVLYTAMPISACFIVFYSLYNIFTVIKTREPLEID
ncbi:TRAP transporter small permease [Kurthia sibirica]|uniref:TRAP transporter small permease n=1 Tax=Kurthia sibirica TaxID=202750 RepID=A0A2U3AI78_9BACL|nr:TRAP transporter small permease [Kurthia sibirica]PWI24194.1 TRAP transporter small permease [Kurthia sibirica]GEK34814.1 C4-dicarboxylate ABC transporter permease [Kurthia sibirica]